MDKSVFDTILKTCKKTEKPPIPSKNEVRIIEFSTIVAISHAIGKNNKSVICINEKNIGEEIYKIICGGEAIG